MAATPEQVPFVRASVSPPSLAMANHNKQSSSSRLPSFSKPRKSIPASVTPSKTTPTSTPSRPPRSRAPTVPDSLDHFQNTPLKIIGPSPEPLRQRATSLQPLNTPSPPRRHSRKITPDTTPSKDSPFL